MSKEFFKVPKKEKPVVLWVHPEGRVVGSVFVREQSLHHIGEEGLPELLNQPEPFLVIYRDDIKEYRFYNKASIVRIEYEYEYEAEVHAEEECISCEMHMMDGSLMSGRICGVFSPDRSRLYDHLNKEGDQYIALRVESGQVHLLNKNYIIYVTSI